MANAVVIDNQVMDHSHIRQALLNTCLVGFAFEV